MLESYEYNTSFRVYCGWSVFRIGKFWFLLFFMVDFVVMFFFFIRNFRIFFGCFLGGISLSVLRVFW